MTAPKTGFLANEPAVAFGGIGAVVSYVMTLPVTHGVITGTQASALTQQVTSGVAALVAMGLGYVIRRYVSPAWKTVQADAAKIGISVPDFPSYTDAEIQAALDALPPDHPLVALNAQTTPPAAPAPSGSDPMAAVANSGVAQPPPV